jgi:type IX secretion system PorP/SprF family membrane protein
MPKPWKIFFVSVVIGLTVMQAQQAPQYSQFTLNHLPNNPAYGGTHLGMEIWMGKRYQWLGFDNAPEQTFVSVMHSWRRNYNYKAVHSVGGYVEQDRLGVFNFKSAHVYYAFHLKLSRMWKMGFGLFAGARSAGVNSAIINAGDPAFNFVKPVLYMYPDFVPGWRIYSRDLFFDVSVKNLYKNKLQQGSQKIGDDSRLISQPIIMAGYRYHSSTNDFVFVPALKIQGLIALQRPLVDVNLITYIRKRVGVGVTYRVGVSASAIVQIRIKNNIMLGFAYEYMVNRLRYYYPGTTEAIFGFSPILGTDEERPSVNRAVMCPEFDY